MKSYGLLYNNPWSNALYAITSCFKVIPSSYSTAYCQLINLYAFGLSAILRRLMSRTSDLILIGFTWNYHLKESKIKTFGGKGILRIGIILSIKYGQCSTMFLIYYPWPPIRQLYTITSATKDNAQ